MQLRNHKTKIVCTIGPASSTPAVMEALMLAGMDIARLNFSHGDFDGHARVIADLRAAADRAGRRIAIMADLPGPKMRIGEIANEPVELKPGEPFTLTTGEITGDGTRVSVSFERLPKAVKRGDTLFLNDGLIQLEVSEVQGSDVVCRVQVGGELRSRKGLNLPGIDLGISAFTGRDHECVRFAASQGIDALCQSFAVTAEDVHAARSAAHAIGYDPMVIAKIERSGAIDNLDAILDAADGIMIARGDLGVEIPIERMAVVQKYLMHKAAMAGKPVITATQMLESMTENRRPTRAESTDVANAILDGTDCVMLSGESAMGRYPVAAAAMLAKIAEATEPYGPGYRLRERLKEVLDGRATGLNDLLVFSVEAALRHATPAAVFVPTAGGYTARSLARFRLPVWIVAVSSNEATCSRLLFSSGIQPVYEPDVPRNWNPYIREWVHAHGLPGELALLTEGPSQRDPDANHRLEIIDLRGS